MINRSEGITWDTINGRAAGSAQRSSRRERPPGFGSEQPVYARERRDGGEIGCVIPFRTVGAPCHRMAVTPITRSPPGRSSARDCPDRRSAQHARREDFQSLGGSYTYIYPNWFKGTFTGNPSFLEGENKGLSKNHGSSSLYPVRTTVLYHMTLRFHQSSLSVCGTYVLSKHGMIRC